MDVKVSKEKYISRWVDSENLIYDHEVVSKTLHKEENDDLYREKW